MSEIASHRIGFLGGGAMAEALAGGLVAAGLPAQRIRVADPDSHRREHLERRLGVETRADNAAAVEEADAVVIAVKPAVVAVALADLGAAAARPLWISIAAGIPLAALGAALPAGARIVRAMPNTPALVRAGATAICGNAAVSQGDMALARTLFESVGTCWIAGDESLLDAVTGLSGSGPAYVFLFLEALVEAGVGVGLPREAATQLATQTLLGAARLASEAGRPAAELRKQVTSPGGTTVAGLERLEALGLRTAIHEAVAAATARSRALAGG